MKKQTDEKERKIKLINKESKRVKEKNTLKFNNGV